MRLSDIRVNLICETDRHLHVREADFCEKREGETMRVREREFVRLSDT